MFTENQVRQLYVVGSVVAGTDEVTNASAAGATKLKESADKKEFFFLHKGASEDGLQRSDLINKCNIMDIRATAADDMKHIMRKVEVTLNAGVNGGAPVVSQDYILNVIIKNYIANGDDSIKVKFGATKATSSDASVLYKSLAISLAKNFSREAAKLVKITLKGDSNNTEITNRTKIADLSAITATGIVLEEAEQPWRRGVAKQEFVNFDVQPSTIYADGMDQVWGDVTDVTASNTNFLPNSKKVADMEYFFHMERGDQYGLKGYPNNIDTVYMVDPSKAAGYSFIDIHFYFEGNSHNVGHSEKTLTLVGDKAALDSFITELESNVLKDYNVTIKKSANW